MVRSILALSALAAGASALNLRDNSRRSDEHFGELQRFSGKEFFEE